MELEVGILFDNVEKQIKTLLENFKEFQITDLIGFARILGVEEKEDFSDFCTDICMAFSQEKRLKRKQLLKLSNDIKIANQNMEVAPPKHQDNGIIETSLNSTPARDNRTRIDITDKYSDHSLN